MLGERIALFQAETEAHGRRYDPMQVVVARDMFIVDNESERQAAIERNNQVHARTLSVSRAPDRAGGSHILAYAHTAEQQRESPLIGTTDEIATKLQTLRAVGVEYLMLNAAGSCANLRRFAGEVMPRFAEPLQPRGGGRRLGARRPARRQSKGGVSVASEKVRPLAVPTTGRLFRGKLRPYQSKHFVDRRPRVW